MKDFTEFQLDFQDIAVLARGGQKVVYSAKNLNYGDVVIKSLSQNKSNCGIIPEGDKNER